MCWSSSTSLPLLGGDYRFLADTPHARIPLLIMVPWFILFIATMVELNFRGFLLGRLLALGLPAPIAVPVSALLFAFDPFLVATFQHLHWIAVWDGLGVGYPMGHAQKPLRADRGPRRRSHRPVQCHASDIDLISPCSGSRKNLK
jgi:hypothetical protein